MGRKCDSILYAALDQGNVPCDNCALHDKCKHEELACRTFWHFVNSGEYTERGKHEKPTRWIFKKIFDESEADKAA